MFEFTTVFIIDIIRKICPPHFSASYYLNFISIGTELCMHLVWYCLDYFLCKVSIIMIIDGTNIWLYFRRQYVLKYYIQLFDKQVVQLKPHEFGELLSKLQQFFPSQNLFWKVKFAIKSIYLAGDTEFFCVLIIQMLWRSLCMNNKRNLTCHYLMIVNQVVDTDAEGSMWPLRSPKCL